MDTFPEVFDALLKRLEHLDVATEKLYLVVDRGVNSNENFDEILGAMHLIASLKRNEARELFALPLEGFRTVGKDTKGELVMGKSARWNGFGRDWRVLVTYRPAEARYQQAKWEKAEGKVLSRVARYRRMRPHVKQKAAMKTAALVPTDFASPLMYVLTPKPKTLEFHVDPEKKARLLRHFGRRMFFTDLDLDAEAIARTYEERTKIEEEFRWMKGDEMMPFSPLFVRKDESILAHAFMAVMGMMLWRLTWKWIRAEGIMAEEREVLEALDELDLVLMSHARRGELRGGEWKVAEHGTLAEELLRKLELEKEIPA